MIRHSKILFLNFFFLFNSLCYVSFAQSPQVKLVEEAVEEVLGSMIGKAPSRGLGYRGWAVEREMALSRLNGTYNDEVMKAVRVHLESPQKVKEFLESEAGVAVNANLVSVNRGWRAVFETFMGQFERHHQNLLAMPVRQIEQVAGGPIVRARLLQYYQQRVARLIKEIRSYTSDELEEILSLKEVIRRIQNIFENPAVVGSPTPEALSIIRKSFEKVMGDAKKKLRDLGGIIREGNVVSGENILKEKLEELCKIIDRHFRMLENYTGVLSFQKAEDVLCAHIRFGSVEEQKAALHHLMGLYEKEGKLTSRETLQKILTLNPSPAYQKFAVSILTQKGVFTQKTLLFLECELQRLAHLFPDQLEFDIAMEVVINILLGRSEAALREVIETSAMPCVARLGAVKTLGQIDSKESLNVLVDLYGKAAIQGTEKNIGGAILCSLEEALVNKAKTNLKTIEEIFMNVVYNTSDHYGRMSAVSGLGKIWAERPGKKEAYALLEILTSYEHPGVQLQALFALSRVGYMDDILIAKIKLYLANGVDNDIRAAAAIYLMPRAEIESMTVIHSLLSSKEGMKSILTDTVVMVLQQMCKHASDISLLKEGLWNLSQHHIRDEIRLEALTLLAKQGDANALRALLSMFDEATVSGSHKKEIIERVLKFSTDKSILAETLQRIIQFYQDPRFSFDFFETFNALDEGVYLLRRLIVIKENPEVLTHLKQIADPSNPYVDLRDFAEILLKFPQ